MYLLHAYGVRGTLWEMIRLWLTSGSVTAEWNGVQSDLVTPKEGLRQGCALSPILCVAFMNAFVCQPPGTSCHSWERALRRKAFGSGLQGVPDKGVQSAGLRLALACLQFVDDTTLLARSEAEMVELLELYSGFCDRFRINLNMKKCTVTQFKAKARDSGLGHGACAHGAAPGGSSARDSGLGHGAYAHGAAPGGSSGLDVDVFCRLHGQPVKRRADIKVLGVRTDCDRSSKPFERHVDAVVNEKLGPVLWVSQVMGERHALRFADGPVMQRALFGAGALPATATFKRALRTKGFKLWRTALGYDRPAKGLHLVPNLALLSESEGLPWDKLQTKLQAELARSLFHPKRPQTWPRLMARARKPNLRLLKDLKRAGVPNWSSKPGTKEALNALVKKEVDEIILKTFEPSCSSRKSIVLNFYAEHSGDRYRERMMDLVPKAEHRQWLCAAKCGLLKWKDYRPTAGQTVCQTCGTEVHAKHLFLECADTERLRSRAEPNSSLPFTFVQLKLADHSGLLRSQPHKYHRLHEPSQYRGGHFEPSNWFQCSWRFVGGPAELEVELTNPNRIDLANGKDQPAVAKPAEQGQGKAGGRRGRSRRTVGPQARI